MCLTDTHTTQSEREKIGIVTRWRLIRHKIIVLHWWLKMAGYSKGLKPLPSITPQCCNTSLHWWTKCAHSKSIIIIFLQSSKLILQWTHTGWRGQGALQGMSGWCQGEESRSGQHQERNHHPDPRDGVSVRPHPQGCKFWWRLSCLTFKNSRQIRLAAISLCTMDTLFSLMLFVPCCRWRSIGSSCSRPRLCHSL